MQGTLGLELLEQAIEMIMVSAGVGLLSGVEDRQWKRLTVAIEFPEANAYGRFASTELRRGSPKPN